MGKQSGLVSLLPTVFASLQLPVSLEPIAQSPWGFHQIKIRKLQMPKNKI